MIETIEAHDKRIKDETAMRAARAAKHAEWLARQAAEISPEAKLAVRPETEPTLIVNPDLLRYNKLKDALAKATDQMLGEAGRIGEMLLEIKRDKLYLQANDCESWQAFCERYTAFTKRRADQLISSTETRELLCRFTSMGRILPTLSDAAIDEIKDLEPRQIQKVIKAVESNGEKPTAKAIKHARAKLIESAETATGKQAEALIKGENQNAEYRAKNQMIVDPSATDFPPEKPRCPTCNGTGLAPYA